MGSEMCIRDSAEVGDTKLIIWDIAGRDSLSPVNVSYLVGASGVVLVADGTRESTITGIVDIWQTIEKRIGNVPLVLALNKCDSDDWNVSEQSLAQFSEFGWKVYFTSAKEGENVGQIFEDLVSQINS